MKELNFKTAFNYPFNKSERMLYILWILLPIIGWFVLGGYSIRIVKEFIKGEFKHLPKLDFYSDLNLGFMMFIKSIPFLLAYLVLVLILESTDSWISSLVSFCIGFFIIPMLVINFFKKETVSSLFEFKIIDSVFKHFGDYVMAMLKSFLLGLIFFIMWIILVGIPAGSFTKNIFLADFYRRRIK